MSFNGVISISVPHPFASTRGPEPVVIPCNFVTFIATAQALGVPFLPTIWQESAGFGAGGTSQIDQATMNPTTSFAFKRVRDNADLERAGLSDEATLKTLINELGILWHPAVRTHHNILELQGVTWDIRGEWENIHLEGEIEGSSERKVWPTFVFEKSELGDLGQFARSATGRELDTSARLTICQDIGNAIGQLHSHRIIHGDIKPTNVIVFREDDGSFTAKVADFGYSVYFSDADQGIKLAQSHPWYAPECNEYRRMKVQQALKTEVFSFGMLCLWFLFEDCRVGASTASNIEGTATSGDALLASMTSGKENGSLAEFAVRLVERESNLDGEPKRTLQQFLRQCLALNPQSRYTDMRCALADLNTVQPPSSLQKAEIKGHQTCLATEADFKLGSLMNALYSSDFRVRHYIVQELVKIVQRDPGNPVAGQLTLCHELGFGRARAQSAHLVLSHQDLEGIKAEFQQGMDSQGLLLEKKAGRLYRTLASRGHERKVSFAEIYRNLDILDAAESIISGEIEGVSPFIGADHLLVVIMKAALSHIKSDLGKLEEALEIQEEVVALCEPYGENDEYYLTVLQDLATLYAENNRLEEAEALSVKVLELTKTALGEEHQDAVVCMINLGALYVDLERTEEAEDLLLGTCAITTRIWHQDHPLTLKARYTLALAYDLQGRYREAIDLMTSVLKGQISTLGGANPDTICTARSLAMIHREQRAYEEAIKIQGYFTKQAGKVLGFTHELTLDVTEDLAETLTQCLHHEEARKLRSSMLEALGDSHPRAAQLKENIALNEAGLRQLQGRQGDDAGS